MSESYKIYASENYVETKITELVNSAPETLNTLNELATALGNDPNFAATIATEIGSKASANDLTSHIDNKSNPHGITVTQIGAVPTSRTVNGKTLSENITLSASDVGALPSDSTAADSSKLGGVAASSYALKTDTAPNSTKFDGQTASYYATASALSSLTNRVAALEAIPNANGVSY